METEICCFSLDSALVAAKVGAIRIELCGGFAEGGTTPSSGLIKAIKQNVDTKVYVMIRPRGGDFTYTKTEQEVIRLDIEAVLAQGVDGLVFGALLPNGDLDYNLCKNVLKCAGDTPVTFHRAFDLMPDKPAALEQIIDLGFERILTSGGANSAQEGIETLVAINNQAGKRIQIMAGGGINGSNAGLFKEKGLQAIHFTAKDWIKSSFTGDTAIQMGMELLPDVLGKYETSAAKAFEIIQKINIP